MALSTVTSAIDAALALLARGFSVIPIPSGHKAPRLQGWTDLRLSAADIPARFGASDNVGVLLGEPSSGRVDVDLDAPEAVAVAPDLLPPTGLIHGRAGKRGSHWWYLTVPCATTVKFRDLNGAMLVELRSTGLQTVVPPSRHPTGEAVTWESDGDPAVIAPDHLRQCVAEVAACALIARHWPPRGSRQDAALALSGFLLRGAYSATRVEAFVGAAARAAADPEWQQRVDAVRCTEEKLAASAPTTGAPTLEKLLKDGPTVLKCVREWLKVGTNAGLTGDSSLPRLDAGDLDLQVITAKALSALEAANTPRRFFLYGGEPIRTIHADDCALTLQPFTPDGLRHELARCARWFKITDTGECRPALPPQYVVRDILASPRLSFPTLRRVVHAPCFAGDGKLIATPGFDDATGIFYLPPPELKIPAVEEAPSATALQHAIELLMADVLVDFPFASQGDRAATLACMLLPFIRDLIGGPTPLHLIEKPQPGTGATLLANVLGEITGSDGFMQITGAADSSEWRKRLTAALLAGPQVLVIDNVHGTLDSDALASAITATVWRDRRLGGNQIAAAPVLCTWIATANNPRLSNEMARRAIRVRLDARTDLPGGAPDSSTRSCWRLHAIVAATLWERCSPLSPRG